ncbi:unnamed protein product [Rhizophagus irregularis]|nr:unnamed protein product [Rhizophagus irregularis]
MFFRALTRDIATNERPALYSFFPISITALGSVSPWLLWIVIAHASVRGICKREQATVLVSQEHRIGVMGTTLLPSVDIIAGPV